MASQEASVAVGQEQPQPFDKCSNAPSQAEKPFVHDISIWAGLQELNLWAGLSSSEQPITWQQVPDAAAWDTAVPQGSSSCPVASNVGHLVGELQSTLHALHGFRSCKVLEAARLTPELERMTAEGWAQVVADDWKFGVEVFLRRLILAQGREVVSEGCFEQLVGDVWSHRRERSFSELTGDVMSSQCAGRTR